MRICYAAALAALIAFPVNAQGQNCAPREIVTERLSGHYGESVQSRGLAENGAVIEMWANVETGSWTAVITLTNGFACFVAAGNSFERIDGDVTPTGALL